MRTSEVAENALTGADINEAALTGNVRALTYYASPSNQLPAPITNIATVGPWTLKGSCWRQGLEVGIALYANGPAGLVDTMASIAKNDNTQEGLFSNGAVASANTDTAVVYRSSVGDANFQRIGGTAMLTSGGTVVEVEFNAVADSRPNHPCFLYGTATKGT